MGRSLGTGGIEKKDECIKKSEEASLQRNRKFFDKKSKIPNYTGAISNLVSRMFQNSNYFGKMYENGLMNFPFLVNYF